MPNALHSLNWDAVIDENKALCERGGFQHGQNSEGFVEARNYFNLCREKELSFAEIVDEFRILHKKAPFLFLNGNTFCSIGIQLAEKEQIHSEYLISSINHHIAGTNILDKQDLIKLFHKQPEQQTDTWDKTAQMIFINLKRGFSYKNELDEINEHLKGSLKSSLITPASFIRVKEILTLSGSEQSNEDLDNIKQELSKMKLS